MQVRNINIKRPYSSSTQQKSRYVEDFENLNFNSEVFIPDDDVPGYNYTNEDRTSEKLSFKSPIKNNNDDILMHLERIEERLAKLEGMLYKVLNNSNNISSIQSQQTPNIQLESMQTPPKGSMLNEIQSILAQQGRIGDSIGDMNGEVVNSVASLNPATYDDDVPNIIGLD